MSKKSSNRAQGTVTLSVRAPEAREVFVAGTFNGWDPWSRAMKRGKGGDWALALDVPPGRYEYKFVIDGRWCCEPGGDSPFSERLDCVPNDFGTMNRVLVVDDP